MKMTTTGLDRFLKSAAAAVEDLWGDQVAIQGVAIPVPCSVSRSAVGGAMSLGGDIPEAILKLRIKKQNLAAAPEHGKTLLTFEGRKWRVDEIQDSPKDEAWALTCVPHNRG